MASSIPPAFGPRLAWTRKRRGFTQAGLARVLDVREKDIQRWEADDNFPRGMTILNSIADALEVPLDFLTGRTSEWKAGALGHAVPDDPYPTRSGDRPRRGRGRRRANGENESTRPPR
jgi:transcriptional regulator with XRE-family HTH domain